MKNARKADKNSSLAFVCEGDIISHFDKTQDGNNVAVGAYEQAKYFDPNSVVALVKLAEAYNKTGNGQESAIGYLNSAIEKRPDYIPAYRFLGKLYYVSGNYGKTIEVYQKFFTGSLKDVAEDYADYAGAYYFTMQFDNAKNILQEGIAKFPNDFYLNRLLMYVSVDTKDYAKGIEYGDKFFSIKRENAPYLIDDYMKYATALTYQNRGEEAVAQYKKAIEMDPDNLAVYKAVANAASSADRPGDAGDIFSEYIKKGGAEVVTGDYFTLGNYYYRAGSGVIYQAANDTTGLISPQQLAEAKEQLVKADSAFAKVVELEPDNYLGYLFRARVNASLDPSSEQGLAKPYYEGLAANILKSNGSKLPNDPEFANLTELREAYYYLSFYTYLRYEKDKSAATKNLLKEYSEKLLAISPEGSNEANIAQQLLDYSKQ